MFVLPVGPESGKIGSGVSHDGEWKMGEPVVLTERRNSPRAPVSISAVVYYNTLMLPDCQVCDLSSDGAYVQTEGHYLPDEAVVDLAFPQLFLYGSVQRVSARVVRSTGDGVGVRLMPTDPAAMRGLVELLYRLPS